MTVIHLCNVIRLPVMEAPILDLDVCVCVCVCVCVRKGRSTYTQLHTINYHVNVQKQCPIS